MANKENYVKKTIIWRPDWTCAGFDWDSYLTKLSIILDHTQTYI